MGYRLSSMTALGSFSAVVMVCAQPGPITTSNNSNLIFAASTLTTNGLPGLTGPPVTLMVATVQSNSAQGGLVSLSTSQPWVRRYNGTANNEDQAFAIVADKDGNIIVGGYSYAIGSGVDYLTIKYTAGGVALWTNRYDGPLHGTDKIEVVAVDGAGGVYVAGLSGDDIVTIKYSSAGEPVWTNTYGTGSSFLFLGGMAVDNEGNAYVLPSDFDSESYITVKYDVSGNATWTNFFNSSATSRENTYGLATDAAGNVFVTGASFEPSLGGDSCLTIKYASNGSALWTNRYRIDGSGYGTGITVDQQGNVVVAAELHSVTTDKYAVVKYSNSGAALWTNVVPAVNYAGGGVPQIATDPAGNVFLVGGTPGSSGVDYTTIKYSSGGLPLWTNRFAEPNGGTPGFFGAGTDNAGNLYWAIESAAPGGTVYNYLTLKYASSGAAVWTNRYNGPANASDLPRAMTVDKAGAVYVTGTSSSGGTSFSALDWATVKYADNVRYVPPVNFVGQDTITFTAFDGFGNSATGTVVINVLAAPPTPPSVVAPDDYTSVPGNNGVNTLIRGSGLARTYQMQFTPDVLGALPAGARVKALRFRLSINAAVNFPPEGVTVTWSDYEVRLAQAANSVAGMSATFQANMLNPMLVKDGPLSAAAEQFTAGGNPNAFSAPLVLDTPYLYQGGDLVMHFTHTGSDSTSSAFLDAVTTSSPGYGTSFRALSANTFGAQTGVAAGLTIVDLLFTPTITQTIARTENEVIVNAAGGFSGATYRILTATNPALPLGQWTPIATNQFGPSGAFSYPSLLQPSVPAQYFSITLP